jgi:hypothetical protein
MPLHLPIQAVVDRAVPLSYAPLIDQEVRNPKTNELIQILRGPVDGPYGPDPGDPAWFPPQVNGRIAVCQVLSSYAVSRCLRGGGYF